MTKSPGTLRGLLRTGAGIAVAMAIQNVATYGFTILAARVLGPAEYGALASLMGLLLVVNVLALGLQATGARQIVADPARREEVEAGVMWATYRSALALGALCLALTPLIASTLQLNGWHAALMIGLTAVPLTLVGGQSGILQGEQRWRPLGAVYLFIGLGRLAMGAIAVFFVPTAFGAMLGVAAGAWLPALVGALALGHVGPRRVPDRLLNTVVRRGGRILREVAANSHALLAFFALSNADILVARVVLDEHVAGLYAGGLILSKAVLFLPQFVVVIAFPSMASSKERHGMYLKGLTLVAAIGVVASVGAALLSKLAITFVGGPAYSEIEPLIGIFAVLGTILAMVQLMVYEVVARQHRASIVVIWVGLAVVAATSFWVSTERELLLSVTLIDLGVLITLVITALLHDAGVSAERAATAAPDAAP